MFFELLYLFPKCIRIIVLFIFLNMANAEEYLVRLHATIGSYIHSDLICRIGIEAWNL